MRNGTNKKIGRQYVHVPGYAEVVTLPRAVALRTATLWLCSLVFGLFVGCSDRSQSNAPSRTICMDGKTDCERSRCNVNEHVVDHRCELCELGTERVAGDDPLGPDTHCGESLVDRCPDDENKFNPGLCGCGFSDMDHDGDGEVDCGSALCLTGEHVVNAACEPCLSGTTRAAGDDPMAGDTDCDDVDECVASSHGCDENARCMNRFGSYHCECDDGFVGDGFHCKPDVSDDGWESPPDFTGLPFSDRIPPFPQYRIPRIEECDWVLENGVATSSRDLPVIEDDYLVGAAYKASIAAGHDLPIIFCVMDDAGTAIFGGGWSRYGNRSVFIEDGAGGYLPMEAEIVGLTDVAEISVGWDTRWGTVDHLGLYNIGLRGPTDSFIIRANSGIGTLIMDGCWWLPSRSYARGAEHEGSTHASGMHIDKWETLVWRRHKWRGEQPGSPGINLREHSGYLKSSRGQTWILENDLRGGNRTGFQIRPEVGHNDRPVGPVVIAYNRAEGYGWNNGRTPETFDGGSALTVWTNPDDSTFIFRNRVTDAKYGCLMVGAQPDGLNWLNRRGFPIRDVYIAENHFENRNGDRGAVGLTAIEDLHLHENIIHGDLTLNSQWGIRRHGITNGSVTLYDPALVDRDIYTYDEDADSIRLMSEAEKRALLADD